MLSVIDLRKLLDDLATPWGRLTGQQEHRPIYVQDLLARARELDAGLTEECLDKLVQEVGGSKEGVSELRDLPMNLLRKSWKRPLKLSNPVYLFPSR